MQAAVIVAPRPAHCCSTDAASQTSGRSSARCSASGILQPIAGTTTQSGACLPTGRTGTVNPCEVLTCFRTPTTVTSNREDDSPDISASSFAVWKASRTVARPVSNTLSNASTETLMARTISTVALLSIASGRAGSYSRVLDDGSTSEPSIQGETS